MESLPKRTQEPGLDQAKARSLPPRYQGITCGWQGPRYLGHHLLPSQMQ